MRLTPTLFYDGPNYDQPLAWHEARVRNPQRRIITTDTETVNTKDNTIIGIGIGLSTSEAYYVTVLPERSAHVEAVMGLLARPDIHKVYHNAVYDIKAFRRLATEEQLPVPEVWAIDDTALMAHNSGRRAALEQVATEFGVEGLFSVQEVLDETRLALGKRTVNMLDADIERVAQKCMNDVRATFTLYEQLPAALTPVYRDCYEVDRRCLSILKTVELRGFALDHVALEGHRERLRRTVLTLKDICDSMGFNPGSPSQVGFILATRGNILPFTKNRRQLRTNNEVLSQLDDPLAHLVLGYRGVSKLLSTYVEPWRGQERAYTNFRLDLSTGRLASFDRNLQNVPESMRDVFQPDSGSFTWGDLSQLEMRLFAKFSGDPLMLKAYREGLDIHGVTHQGMWPETFGDTASGVYAENRRRAKTFNFAMIFDATTKTLAFKTHSKFDKVEQWQRDWLALYSQGAEWIQEQMDADVDVVYDIYGRAMRLPEYDVNEWGRDNSAHRNRCKVNYPIQGSGASIVKRQINYLWDHGYADAYRLQVHDEHVLDGDVEFPVEAMRLTHPDVETPIDVKHGSKWK